MARSMFVSFVVAFFLGLSALDALAAPIFNRQVGNQACNQARVSIIENVAAAKSFVSEIDTSDPAAQEAVDASQTGLQNATAGIKTILGNIAAGQQASADARDQVGQGLGDAFTALQGIENSADPAVTYSLSSVQAAIADGDDVVAQCK